MRGHPLRAGGCRVMGWWLSAPPLPQWRGRGFPCASHLCGVGLRTEVGGGFIGGGRRIRTCSFSVMGAVCFRYTSPRCARVVTLLGGGGPGLLRSSPGACLAGARRGARRFPGRGSGCIVAAPARSTYRIVWWQFVREDIPSLPIRESVTSRLLRSSVQAKHTCPSRRTRLPRILCGRRRGWSRTGCRVRPPSGPGSGLLGFPRRT